MENAGKRSLDDDSPETVGDDPKRLKIDCDLQVPSMDNTPIPEVKDVNKWKLLPSILCELFTLFKSSNAAKDQPEKVIDDTQKESTVLENPICEEKYIVSENVNFKNEDDYSKISDGKSSSSSELLGSIKPNDVVEFKSVKENSTLILGESKMFTNGTKDEEVQKNMTSSIQTNPVSIENNDQKVKPKRDEASEVVNVYQNSALESSLSHSASTSKSTKNDIKKNNLQHSIKENILRLAKRGQVLNLLKNICLNGMAEIPISKPPACICKHCIYVDNLPIEQSAVSHRSTSYTNFQHNYHNYQSLNSDVYSSSQIVSDCSVCASKGIYTTNDCSCVKLNSNYNWEANTESSRSIWINDLTSLIRKNEDKFKIPEVKNKNSYVKTAINKVKKTAKQIKTHIALCKVCKNSKFSDKVSCKCSKHLKNNNYYCRNKKYNRY